MEIFSKGLKKKGKEENRNQLCGYDTTPSARKLLSPEMFNRESRFQPSIDQSNKNDKNRGRTIGATLVWSLLEDSR